MALPSAQLGSMPSLGPLAPVPTQVIEKRVPLWQQLLSQIALQTAGAAATQGVGNVMERDYATEFGKTPAKGFDRLRGATVDARQAEGLRKTAADQVMQKEDILARSDLEKFRQAAELRRDAGNIDARATSEQMAFDRLKAEMDQKENLYSRGLAAQDNQEALRIKAQSLRDQIQEAQQGPARTAQMARDAAATAKLMAETEGQNTQNKGNARVVENMLSQGMTAPTSQPTAGLKNFATELTPRQAEVLRLSQDRSRYGETGRVHPAASVSELPTTAQLPTVPPSPQLETATASGPMTMPASVERAAAVIANAPKGGPELAPYKAVIQAYLDQNPPYSEDSLNLYRLLSR